ncbi:MAG: hypothetical protein RIR12_216 [Bacteroidota bacterium]|jgi:PAS domain S-box-containing protein
MNIEPKTSSFHFEIKALISIIILFFLLSYFYFFPDIILKSPLTVSSPNTWIAYIAMALLLAIILLFIRQHYKKIATEKTELLEMMQRYEAVSIATSDAIWDYNLQTGETYYNDRIYTIFGYSKKDTVDNANWWTENIHPEDKKRVENKLNTYLSNGKTFWEEEYRFQTKSKEYKIVYDRSFIIFNDKQVPIRLIGAMKDITQLREFEKKQLELQLEQKDQIGKKIIELNEEEKRKLKDQLQEDINQILASVKLNINSLPTPTDKPNVHLEQSIEQLTVAMSKIKEITNQLHSSTLDFFGLVIAVTEMMSDTEENFNAATFFDHKHFNEREVSVPIQLILFRVLQSYFKEVAERMPKVISITLAGNAHSARLQIKDLESNQYADASSLITSLNDLSNKIAIYKGKLFYEIDKTNSLNLDIVF